MNLKLGIVVFVVCDGVGFQSVRSCCTVRSMFIFYQLCKASITCLLAYRLLLFALGVTKLMVCVRDIS